MLAVLTVSHRLQRTLEFLDKPIFPVLDILQCFSVPMHFLSSSDLPGRRRASVWTPNGAPCPIRRVWRVLGSGCMYWRYFWTVRNAGYYVFPLTTSLHKVMRLSLREETRMLILLFSQDVTNSKQTNKNKPQKTSLSLPYSICNPCESPACVWILEITFTALLLRELSSSNLLCHSVPTDNNGDSARQIQPQS